MKEKTKTFWKNRYVKVFLWSLFALIFLSPFPVPYLYKLDRQLVGEGKFVSHSVRYEAHDDRRSLVRIDEFVYLDDARNTVQTLGMDADDNSAIFNNSLMPGQHVYIYALGPLKWTAATTVKDDLRGIFWIRAFIEFSVRIMFGLLAFLIIGILCGGISSGGGLLPTSWLMLYGGMRF